MSGTQVHTPGIVAVETVDVRGQRLRVSRQGTPLPGTPPLLLVNGIGATADLFEPFRSVIAALDGRETIAFDAPGVGGSPVPFYPPTMRGLAATVAGLIRTLGFEQADVLGLSWGGALTQELAYRHPDAVRRVVLAATMHGWTSTPGRPTAVATLMTPARYYSTRYLEAIAPTLYGREILQHSELLRRHAQIRVARPPSPVGYVYQLAALRRWTSLPWLHRLRQPTLVLAGDDDPIIPLANMARMAGLIPQSQLVVVAGGGHLFLYLRAQDMAARVLQFLAAD